MRLIIPKEEYEKVTTVNRAKKRTAFFRNEGRANQQLLNIYEIHLRGGRKFRHWPSNRSRKFQRIETVNNIQNLTCLSVNKAISFAFAAFGPRREYILNMSEKTDVRGNFGARLKPPKRVSYPCSKFL